jgi:tetratricopeptide (TPR) repeat protein
MLRALLALLLLFGAVTLVRDARAQEAPAAPAPTPAAIEEAKRFFEQGESLRGAGQYQAALEAYLKSRSLVPRASNTLNAAVCLHALKRYDEAFDMFEEALTKYPEGQVSKESKDSAKKAMADIEALVGRIDVSANIDGSLVIDGRTRGKLPLVAPVRVLAGKHVVRVLRDGYETFEQAVEVKERATTAIDAKLNPLTSAGRLRIEAPAGLDGATVIVDGATVGA